MRVKAQPSQEEKIAAADVVIDTSGTMADTQEFFDLLWSRLTHDFVPTAELPPIFEEAQSLMANKPQAAVLPVESTPAIPPKRLDTAGAAELREMMNYFEDHTYFGPNADRKLALARELSPEGFTSFADWASRNMIP